MFLRRKKKVNLPALDQVVRERRRLKRNRIFVRSMMSTISVLIVVAAVAVLISSLFLSLLQVSGSSMEPTLYDGQVILLLKTRDFKTGQLVGLYHEGKILLKRVIGGAGDYITIDEDGNVAVNGQLLDEPYVTEKSLGECDIRFPYQVPDRAYFVMGDHRSTSIDSRSSVVGSIRYEQIIGLAVARVWPLSEFEILKIDSPN